MGDQDEKMDEGYADYLQIVKLVVNPMCTTSTAGLGAANASGTTSTCDG
jgi:hypothetical protein